MIVPGMDISRADSRTSSELAASSGSNATTGVSPSRTGSSSQQSAEQDTAADQVQLSNLGSYLASALDGSPSHVAKLDQLSTAVSSGQYHVDAYSLSGSIIQHSIDFGSAGQSTLSV